MYVLKRNLKLGGLGFREKGKDYGKHEGAEE